MTKYSDYTNYFKSLATALLGHSDSEKHFYRKGLEEFLNGMSTEVTYPAMLLDKYDFKYVDNGADNVMRAATAAFIICDHVKDREDYAAIDAVLDSTLLIVDKIYNRMREEISHPGGDFLKDARLNNIQVTPVENYADQNFGWFVTIEIFSFHNTSII